MSNSTTITGNLTREPEIRYTKEGQATAQLGVAVNRRWQDRTTQEWQESTSFFDVICWRDLAENVALEPDQGHAGCRHRAAGAPQLGNRRGRAPFQGRDRGRRDRSEPALRHRRRAPDRAVKASRKSPSQARPRALRSEAWVPSRVTGSRPVARPGAHGNRLTERHHQTTTHDAPASASTPYPRGQRARGLRAARAVDRATLVDNPQTPCDRGRISRGPLRGPPRLA